MNKKQNFIFIFSILSFFIVFSHSLFSKTTQSSEIMRAMRDEITRSMNELKIEGLERPYFIEYLLKITSDYSINSKLGTIVYSNTEGKQVASLTTIVKVGSYKFDNSGFDNIAFTFYGSTTDDDNENYINRCIPADIDYNMLRRELWLATDASYKNAAEYLTKKKVIIEDKIVRDTTWDFSMVKPLQAVDTSKIEEFNDEKYTNLLIELSNIFSSHSEILNSQVDVNYTPETIYYVNSEGTEYIKNTSFFALNIGGYSQREDGMPIADAYSVVCNKPSELPDKDSLIKATNKIISNIKSSIKASVLEDPYSGPILFLGSASCELLSKHFANNLMVQRKTRSARGAFTIVNDHPFQSKIGGRVLPTFMTVEDKPLLKQYKNINLLGYYTIDDEGVLAQDVTLVKDGYLKTLLSTRIPIKRVNESNGHNRDNNNPMYSNLIISSDETQQLSDEELKKYMLKLCKDRDLPYGIVVKNIISSNLISSLIAPISNDNILNIETFKKGICLFSEIYKIFPDGREEKIVGGTISGISVNTFKDIVKTGNNLYVYNFLMGKEVFVFSVGNINMNIKNFVIPATIIAPSLLIEDCEVQVSETDYNRTNILKSPLLDY